MSQGTASTLEQSSTAAREHLRSICEFSLNRPPLRPKVDMQSYTELKPVVERAIALLDWFNELQQIFSNFLGELAKEGGTPSVEHLTLIVSAVDECIVLENQFGGWSQLINRFSWFKRTFQTVRQEVVSTDPTAEKLTKDLGRFQGFIGAKATLPPMRQKFPATLAA